ncbi:hypothetical protein [Desulfofundulus thermosubterraneus]|uniref:hypothetical protein n=1 Tax=Desulfofundulus thermosubterraneus TaxID=348840 RepID=UPI0013F4C784|nr:hypothetical protein [Desulfofundulus thermosubterraneus]
MSIIVSAMEFFGGSSAPQRGVLQGCFSRERFKGEIEAFVFEKWEEFSCGKKA